ncbi:armadillo-type protein [Mycena crocata]|nr:armadillo-type protein [Mycena crocata]
MSRFQKAFSPFRSRAALTTALVQEKIISMLQRESWLDRLATINAMTNLSSAHHLRPGIITVTIVEKLVSMVEDNAEGTHVRKAVVECFTALSQYGDVRSAIIMPRIPSIVSTLNDRAWYSPVSEATSRAIAIFCQHEDARLIISEEANMRTMEWLLASPEWTVRERTLEVFSALMKYEEIRAAMKTNGVIQKIISVVGDADWDVREAAVKTVFELVKHDILFAEIAVEQNLVSMLDASGEVVRGATVVAVLSDALKARARQAATEQMENLKPQNDDEASKEQVLDPTVKVDVASDTPHETHTRQLDITCVATSAVCGKLFSMLEHPEGRARQAILRAIVAIWKHVDARHVLRLEDRLKSVLAKLDDPDSEVQSYAVDCVIAFLDDRPSGIGGSAQDITSRIPSILSRLSHSDWDVRQQSLGLVVSLDKHGHG